MMSVPPHQRTSSLASTDSSINGDTTPASSVSSAVINDGPSTEMVLKDSPDGEINLLMQSLEDENQVVPLTDQLRNTLKRTVSERFNNGSSGESVYGEPLSVVEAAERMPPGDEGLITCAAVIPDQFFVNGKLLRGLRPRDFLQDTESIKPRRAMPTLTVTNLLSSLANVGPRYIFYGILNGWPSLRCLEVIEIEQKRAIGWNRVWKASVEGIKGIPLQLDSTQSYRATLRGAPWTSKGYSKDSPGFLFWFEAQRPQGPRVLHGTNILNAVDDSMCTHIHMISHRYAVKRESPRDLLTYHSVCLLEWDHGKYTTVMEVAFLNGIGGYNGRSNWYHDKDERTTLLFKCMPPEMISPWRTNSAELRCYDVEARNLDEFMQFVQKYKGNTQRFIDPKLSFSHQARLTFRTRKHIAQYLLNYISRDPTYADLKRNCQTFAADLCSFIAGKKDVQPFHPVSRMEYQNRTYLFLYDSHLYEQKQDKKAKGKKV